MKNHRSGLFILCLAALLGGSGDLKADTTLVSYNFDSLNTGTLAGQDNWTTATGGVSPVISANNSTSGYSDLTNVADRSATSGTSLIRNSALFSAGSLNTSDLLTLSMNVYVGGTGSTSFFGIGGPSYVNGGAISASFGILNGLLAVRGEGNGTVFNAENSSGGTISLTTGHWYTLQSVWDLSTGTATLAYEDLTAGATSFTTVYFDAAQTQTTVNLVHSAAPNAVAFDPTTWNSVYIRTGDTSAGVGFVDNLSVTVSAVPEPSAVALAGLALLLGAASWQRKRAFAR